MYAPMRMTPVYQQRLWGGTRLKREFRKADAPDATAESWELAARPDGASLVAEGPFAGKSLLELGGLDRPGLWGSACRDGRFPLLVKLIDAGQDLSVQVHPSDETALARLGEQGKAEMWYIVDCAPQASIYYGFSQRIDRAQLLARARDGSICQVLNRVPVSRGDVFYILPGTIHAIGAGIVIAEIQQDSDTTFRVYDYGRLGADGAPRALHLERAAQVLDYGPMAPRDCRANSGAHFPEFTLAEMFSCRYFRAYRVDVRGTARLSCDGRSFHHLLCVEGAGRIRAGTQTWPLGRGDSFFMPAALGAYEIEGSCRVLLSHV